MRVTRGIPVAAGDPSALTIGNFDGVHVGHQAMLAELKCAAARLDARACVLTFEPHPREFFAPDKAPTRLTSLREKLELLASFGVERTHAGLAQAIGIMAEIEHAAGADSVLANMALAARFVAGSALLREETRGAHARSDFPAARQEFASRSFLTLAELDALGQTTHTLPRKAQACR